MRAVVPEPRSPLDQLLAALRAAADAEVAAWAPLAARARAALDAYEAAARSAAEIAVANRVAPILGLPLVDAPDLRGARVELVASVRDLLAVLAEDDANRGAGANGVDGSSKPIVELVDDPGSVADAPNQTGESLTTDAEETPTSSRPLTREELAAWLQRSAETPPAATTRVTQPRKARDAVLRTLVERAGTPPALTTDIEELEELEALEALTAEDQVKHWHDLSRDDQVSWLSFLVARARALKERVHSDPVRKKRLREAILRFPEFAAAARPGHVNGMRQAHEPLSGSWTRDAHGYLSELRTRLDPQVEDPRPPKASRKREKEPTPAAPPIDWPFRERVESMCIVLFGGSPREDARLNLERRLGIGALEWPESDKPRRVDALAERVRVGKVGMLIINRFVHHTEAAKLIAAAQESDTPFAMLESGYGLEAVRQAIEHALQRTNGASTAYDSDPSARAT
jgi:hypothetical protein